MTPPAAEHCLPSIMIDVLEQIANALGQSIVRRPVSFEEPHQSKGERRWELSQGSVATSEDRVTTARAELRQEAGQEAGVWRNLGTIHEAYGYSNATCDVFGASDVSSVYSAPEPSEGGLVSAWCAWAEMRRLVEEGQITDAVFIASLAMSHRRRRTECE